MSILVWTFLIPAIAALVILFIPNRQHVLIKVVAGIAAAATLGIAIYIFQAYDFRVGGYQFEGRIDWLPALGISLHTGVDGISVPMVLLTGIVIFTGVLVMWKITNRPKDFFALLLLLVSGVFGVFVTLDLFILFFFYELAVIPMYLLIGVWGASSDFGIFKRTKEYSAMKLMLVLTAGSVLVWIALIALYVNSDIKTFDIVTLMDSEFSTTFQNVFFPLVLIGFGVLAGLWPFHTWSPDGHVAAPTAVSMLHAGVLMKLGAYGIIRVGMTLFPEGAQNWMPLLVGLAIVNVVYGAISAMAQKDLKYVVGYSSVSHMGYVLLGLGTLSAIGVNGAVLQMFSHGIMTALLFALVGIIYDQAHTRAIADFGGLAKRLTVVTAFFIVAGLTSLGLPGLSGFVAEFMIFVGTFRTYPWIGVLAVFAAAITAVYILRLLATVFFGPLNPKWEKLEDAVKIETFATAILVGVIIFVGVYPSPFMRVIDSAVVPLLSRVAG